MALLQGTNSLDVVSVQPDAEHLAGVLLCTVRIADPGGKMSWSLPSRLDSVMEPRAPQGERV